MVFSKTEITMDTKLACHKCSFLLCSLIISGTNQNHWSMSIVYKLMKLENNNGYYRTQSFGTILYANLVSTYRKCKYTVDVIYMYNANIKMTDVPNFSVWGHLLRVQLVISYY